MTPMYWFGLLAFAAYLALVAWVAMRGGNLTRVQGCRLECPLLQAAVEARIVQDVRTGQWRNVERCSAFESGKPSCRQDCLRLMNLGLRAPLGQPS